MIQATKSSAPNAARSGFGPRDTGPVASGGPEFFAGPASFGPGADFWPVPGSFRTAGVGTGGTPEEGPELRAREAGVISLADCGRSFLSDPITLLLSIGREGYPPRRAPGAMRASRESTQWRQTATHARPGLHEQLRSRSGARRRNVGARAPACS